MTTLTRRAIQLPEGFRSPTAALVFGSLEDQSQLLWKNLEGITPDELQFQQHPGMNGKDLAWYRALSDKARAYVRSKMAGITDADVEAETIRTRSDGTSVAITGRWYLYHALEHFSGHYGQILLLRHLYRDAQARG